MSNHYGTGAFQQIIGSSPLPALACGGGAARVASEHRTELAGTRCHMWQLWTAANHAEQETLSRVFKAQAGHGSGDQL